jgi:multiple sugar transport system ATP-binding protein
MQRIELQHITKSFGKFKAVDDISLVIEPGSFLTLLGPSGCGKTTVLRMIAGLEEPDDGNIVIGDQTVFSRKKEIMLSPFMRRVGLVFQSYALWPHMTVFQNVAFGLQLAKKTKAEVTQRVEETLKDMQIQDMSARYPQEMSGGQQQRVALARMMAPRPDILLLDEPLSNLDARLRMDMRSELKRLHHDTGATTIYVTHDQLEALTMSTHIVVMKNGCIQQFGTPDEIYSHPSNLFVADFIGSPKVNLLPGEATVRDGKTCVKSADFELSGLPLHASGKVMLSIRPEDIHISTQPVKDGVEFNVYSVLPAGSETIITARRGATTLTIKEPRRLPLEMDRAVWLNFDLNALNLYDKDSGQIMVAQA